MRWVKLSIFNWLFLILHNSHYWKVILLYYTACIQIDTISPCFKLSHKTHNLVELVEMYYLFQLIRDLIYWTYIVLAAQIVISCWLYILPPILYEWFWERYYFQNAFFIMSFEYFGFKYHRRKWQDRMIWVMCFFCNVLNSYTYTHRNHW